MASYTKITKTEIKAILELYGLEAQDVTLSPLSDGISNSNYRVSFNDQTVLLKISNDKNAEELNSEHAILKWLAKKEYPLIVAPMNTLGGHTVYNYQNYTGALFPFIESEPYQKDKETMSKLGVALAKLHKVSENETNLRAEGLRLYKSVGFGIKQILNYTQRSTCPQDFKEAFEKIYPENLAEKLTDLDLPGGVLHGDFYFDNALFLKGELRAMLDFEQAGIGRFVLDLGIALSGSAVEGNEIQEHYLKAYLQGYESVRPLSLSEKEVLRDAIIVGLLAISLWRIKRFTEGDIDKNKKDSYKELLNRALHFNQKFTHV